MCGFEGTGKQRKNQENRGLFSFFILFIGRKNNMPVKKEEYKHIKHSFKPVFDHNSKILILGSFPSVKSRNQGFYYGHPQNRFWKVLSAVMKYDENYLRDADIEKKKAFLIKNNLAVWDVIDSCDIIGSSDSSIKNVIPADIEGILKQTSINMIVTNGKLAGKLYEKYFGDKIDVQHLTLPSTSPANAVYNIEKLIVEWSVILESIK